MLKGEIQSWDARRELVIPGDENKTIAFCAEHWIHTAQRALQQKGRFAVALSGGSTPKAIFALLTAEHKKSLDWSRVHLFWSDERNVPLDHADSNYHMAMKHGFQSLPIPPSQIHPMRTSSDLERSASDYEALIHRLLGPDLFDLVMLGVGEDGHTASLFPHTKTLTEAKRLVLPNHLPETNQWRLTLTYPAINQSTHTALYALGPNKQAIVPLVLNAAIRSPFPASAIGTPEKKALWILDQAAAHLLKND
jgi:6-phosphogluconolactonase